MSIALTIEKVDGKEIGREFPISTNKVYSQFWEPVVLQEGFLWLDLLLSPGFDLTEADLPEVISEFRRLKQAVPRYYAPDSTAYQHMEERLSGVIAELEALVGKRVELFLG
ncbi:MAG: hypothetical protein ACRYG7_02085 [Janthinobacterium lividum]